MSKKVIKEFEPSIEQDVFVSSLLDGNSIAEASRTAGIDRNTFYKTWKKNPDFLEYYKQRRTELLGSRTHKIDLKLAEQAEKGDRESARLWYQRYGYLTESTAEILPDHVLGANKEKPEKQAPAAGQKIGMLLDDMERKQKANLNVVK